MTKKMGPIELELNGKVQEAVLDVSVRREDGSLTTVRALVEEARTAFEQANQAVRDNFLIQLIATQLMMKEKRRGSPRIIIRMDGSAVLRVSYGEDSDKTVSPLVAAQSFSKKLPSLDILREKAAEMGVDISDLGRKKREIIKRLESKAND